MTRSLLVAAFLLLSTQAHAQWTPPFDAWIASQDDVWVRPGYRSYSPSVGLLRYGNTVRIIACENNDCTNPSWVMLEPYGSIRLSVLAPMSTITREALFWRGTADTFLWAKARRAFTTSTGEHFRSHDEIVFRRSLGDVLERPDGGTVNASYLTVFTPSTFSGWVNPPSKFAFALRDIVTVSRVIPRYTRINVQSVEGAWVRTPEVSFLRSDVRMGYSRPRPAGVPAHTRWVHVDLDQQILTAYDYNDSLVFATLVSTGRGNNQTDPGVFQVRRKTYHTHMAGGGSGRGHYSVDGVPWVMFFNEAIALHGAFWHDQFGTKRSHGCVNLSLADARFLFEFAPMEVPEGWRAVHPIALGINNLWVVIE